MEKILLIVFGIFLLALIVLDVSMIISLVRPGDERKQMIVWKASTVTLLGVAGSLVIDVPEALIKGDPMTVKAFIKLSAVATVYFFALLFFKKRYGG